jgi:hypothetical protein
MKEWDIDSYNRKWRQAFGVFRCDGTLHWGLYNEFIPVVKRQVVAYLTHVDGKGELKAVIEDRHPDYLTMEPLYYPLSSGWYATRTKHTEVAECLLVRRHLKGFQVGVNRSNYSTVVADEKGQLLRDTLAFYCIDPLTRPPFQRYDPEKKFGVLSPTLSYMGGILYYLTTPIGLFKKGKLSLENQAFVPYVTPYLGATCPIAY